MEQIRRLLDIPYLCLCLPDRLPLHSPDGCHEEKILQLACHCEGVILSFPSPEEPLNECLCSICRRYAALWAYYQPEEVQIKGETEFYVWGG